MAFGTKINSDEIKELWSDGVTSSATARMVSLDGTEQEDGVGRKRAEGSGGREIRDSIIYIPLKASSLMCKGWAYTVACHMNHLNLDTHEACSLELLKSQHGYKLD